MKLPVFPRGDNEIIDEVSEHVCFTKKTGDRDYIVKAVNSYEKCDKYEKAIQYAIELMDEEPAKKILEQALK